MKPRTDEAVASDVVTNSYQGMSTLSLVRRGVAAGRAEGLREALGLVLVNTCTGDDECVDPPCEAEREAADRIRARLREISTDSV